MEKQECFDSSNPEMHQVDKTESFVELYCCDDSDIDEDATLGGAGIFKTEPIERKPLTVDDEEADNEQRSAGEWEQGVCQPQKLSFIGKQGLDVPLANSTPLDFFRLMVNDEMVSAIATETNRYAAATLAGIPLPPSSRWKKWVDVTVQEMWAFFGLIISMGLIVLDDLDDYWSSDPVYDFPFFRSVMKRDRFCLILSFFHISNNEQQPDKDSKNYDPLFKIKDFVSSLTANFRRAFLPGRNITVDEAMVAKRGPCAFKAKVNNPDEPAEFGIKVFGLYDSETGYCCNLEFFTGTKQASARGASFDIIETLISPYLHCGRTLYVDNGYTSPDLFTYLRENGTMACGIMRRNKENGPPKDMFQKLQRGDVEGLTNGSLNLLRFFKREQNLILTTAHDDSRVSTGKVDPVLKQPVTELAAVADYIKCLGAVDHSHRDHIMAFNPFRRRTLKWWKRTFFHMLAKAVYNSYLLFKAYSGKPLRHRAFRKELTKQLVAVAPIPVQHLQREVGDSVLHRLTGRHFPQLIQPKGDGRQKKPLRNCTVCSEPSRRKRSRYECAQCNVGLHVDKCFDIYHTREDFKHCHNKNKTADSPVEK